MTNVVGMRMCVHLGCGAILTGRQRLYCCDAHRKAHKRWVQREMGESLKEYADNNMSAHVLSSAERATLTDNLRQYLKWERINQNNAQSAEDKIAHRITADVLQIIIDGVKNG